LQRSLQSLKGDLVLSSDNTKLAGLHGLHNLEL
jgi:hypothetical protein